MVLFYQSKYYSLSVLLLVQIIFHIMGIIVTLVTPYPNMVPASSL